MESHLGNEPQHTKVQDPKHLQEKTAVKQRISPRDRTLLTTASEKKKDLGITITDNLQWSQHRDINQISLRANRIPDIICSPGRDISDTDIRTLLYCSIAQPKLGKLEYASELWSPYTCTFARKCSAHSYGVYFKLSERHVLQGSVSQT